MFHKKTSYQLYCFGNARPMMDAKGNRLLAGENSFGVLSQEKY